MVIEREIQAPASAVWRLLADTRWWPRWGPSVKAVDATEEVIAAGTRGRVKTALGVWLSFSVTAFEPGRYWRWRVGGIVNTGHRVQPLGPRRSRLTFELPGWIAPYGLVCRMACERIAALAEGQQR